MKNLIRIIFFLFISTFGVSMVVDFSYAECGFFSWGGQCESQPPYCQGDTCNPEDSTKAVKVLLPWLSDKPISEYIQDIVTYLLGFISIVAVLYIIYAGFQVMTGAGDEEKMKKARNIILYVIIGIIIMWLAFGIVTFTLNLIK